MWCTTTSPGVHCSGPVCHSWVHECFICVPPTMKSADRDSSRTTEEQFRWSCMHACLHMCMFSWPINLVQLWNRLKTDEFEKKSVFDIIVCYFKERQTDRQTGISSSVTEMDCFGHYITDVTDKALDKSFMKVPLHPSYVLHNKQGNADLVFFFSSL